MPRLERIIVRNWRNIELQELDFCPNMNCICGDNGEGKTNLLDAIYYLSLTKSAFSTSDRFNYRSGEKELDICGVYDMERGDIHSKFSIKSSASGEKKILRDGKPYTRLSEHIGLLPIVMVSPNDSVLVSEGSEERRKFVSSVLSQIDREHLVALQNYNRLLAQRNALLKSDKCSDDLLDSIDYNLDRLANSIYRSRTALLDTLRPKVQNFYRQLSAGKEAVDIKYSSDLDKGSLMDLLADSREKDKMLMFTTCGVQRDDFLFLMNDSPIRRTGSQGQQKCFLVALKFAQYELMKSRYGFPPILLLDDLFDKLDVHRTENLLQMVSGEDFGQIFLSDTNKLRVKEIIDKFTAQSCYYEVHNGVFSR